MLDWLGGLISRMWQGLVNTFYAVLQYILDFISTVWTATWNLLVSIAGYIIDQFLYVMEGVVNMVKQWLIDLLTYIDLEYGYTIDFDLIANFYLNIDSFFPVSQMLVLVGILLVSWIWVKSFIFISRTTLFICTFGQA